MKKIVIGLAVVIGIGLLGKFAPSNTAENEAESWIPYFTQVKKIKAVRSPLQEIMPQSLRYDGIGAMTIGYMARAGRTSAILPYNGKGSYRSSVIACEKSQCYDVTFSKDPKTVRRQLDQHKNWLSAISSCYSGSQLTCQMGWVDFGQEHGVDVVGAMYDYLDSFEPKGMTCEQDITCRQLTEMLGALPARP